MLLGWCLMALSAYIGYIVPIPNSKGNPFTFSRGYKYTGVGKIGGFQRKSPFISEKVRAGLCRE